MKRIITRKQNSLRPTTGKVREALFDILRGKIKNSRFLDLYAGTGAVGITALHEGAAEVVFVEESKGNTKKIYDLINKSPFSGKTTIINKKVLQFVDWAGLNEMSFDVIFLDPPYHTDEIINALSSIEESQILCQNGLVIAEHFAKRNLPEKLNRLQKIRDYTYGDSVLSLYQKYDDTDT